MDNHQQQSFGFNPNMQNTQNMPNMPNMQMGAPHGQPGQPGQPSAPQDKDPGKKGIPLPTGPSTSELMERISSMSRRLRMLEERYSTLINKNQLTDQNMLANHKKLQTEIKSINMELTEMKSEIAHIKETNTLIIQDLRECARREDVEVLEKYLKLWEPVRFVTQNQVENIVMDIIENLGLDKKEDSPKDSKK